MLSIGPLGTNFSEVLSKIQNLIQENASQNIVCEITAILSRGRWVNSSGPSDAIWRCRSGSTLAQVMACCLAAPSHYLNQCWHIISKVHWYSYEGNLALDALAINHYYYLENHLSKFSFKFPRGQWVKAQIWLGHVGRQPLLGPLTWYPAMQLSLGNSFGDRTPVDGI